jgi:hypothetical protein
MTTINAQSVSQAASAPAEKPRPKAEGGIPAEAPAPAQNTAAGDAVSEGLAQSARYRMMREANTLSAESAVADADMALELTASVRDLILGRSADSVRIQSEAIPRGAFGFLE